MNTEPIRPSTASGRAKGDGEVSEASEASYVEPVAKIEGTANAEIDREPLDMAPSERIALAYRPANPAGSGAETPDSREGREAIARLVDRWWAAEYRYRTAILQAGAARASLAAASTSSRHSKPSGKEFREYSLNLLRDWYHSIPAGRWRNVATTLASVYRLLSWISRILKPSRRKRFSGDADDLARLRRHVPVSPRHDGASPPPTSQGFESCVLYRIVGNDLQPRHEPGQSRRNVSFILEHEADLAGCRKRWLLNRIFDDDELRSIVDLLKHHHQEYDVLPFRPELLRDAEWDLRTFPTAGFLSSPTFASAAQDYRNRAYIAAYRFKNNAVMNNNGARNAAIEAGQKIAGWVLPWDGNCYLRASAWDEIRSTVAAHPHVRYVVVPMERLERNESLLTSEPPRPPTEEPQVIFRTDAAERFSEAHPYGRRPKVELLRRLGVPGPWDRWRDDPWEIPSLPPSADKGNFIAAGSVARLASGSSRTDTGGEGASRWRRASRQDAIRGTIHTLLYRYFGDPTQGGLCTLDRRAVEALASASSTPRGSRLVGQIADAADVAMRRLPSCVTDKPTPGPSGDPHDYFHPAPFWWPNPETTNGLPYVRREGRRLPGTELYGPDSDRYDRSRLQRLFDDSLALTLAWVATGRDAYADHAARWFRAWFVDETTRMNPHLRYAQVRCGHRNNEGDGAGIIEMKDIGFYLDAIRMLHEGGILSDGDLSVFRMWLDRYQSWLLSSRQGVEALTARSSHGSSFDLQSACIAAFLDDDVTFWEAIIRARDRIAVTFTADGVPLHQIESPNTAHSVAFAIYGWLTLAEVARRHGDTLAHYATDAGAGLQAAVDWLAAHYQRPWPYPQTDRFDPDRLLPIFSLARRLGLVVPGFREADLEPVATVKPCFPATDGIRPFWALEPTLLDGGR